MFGVFPEIYKFSLVSKFYKDYRENIPNKNRVGTEISEPILFMDTIGLGGNSLEQGVLLIVAFLIVG